MTRLRCEPLFITTDAVGGVWSYSMALARGLAAAGGSCVMAVLGPAPDAAQRAEVASIQGCTLLETGLPLEWKLHGRGGLDPLIASLTAMAAHCQAASAHLHAPSLACQPWPVPVAAVAHSCMATWWDAVRGGSPPHAIAWHATATHQGLLYADAVVAPSESFAAALRRVYRLTRPVHVVHNGLPRPVSRRAERMPVVLTAGRLWDPAKNLAVLDDAAALLAYPVEAAGPLCEPGGTHASFAHLKLLGRLEPEQLGDAMAQACVFASSSLYEPFGLAVLEAAQRATPLVLSDIPTFRELWSDAALFVPAGDAAGWASSIDALMSDAPLRRRLGRAASRRAQRYSLTAMVGNTTAIHHALTSARRAA